MSALKPRNIVQAADADLRLLRRKLEGDADPFMPYCFHRHHVNAADSARGLIAIALRDRDTGRASGKRWTRLVYEDEELLRAALLAASAPQMTAAAE